MADPTLVFKAKTDELLQASNRLDQVSKSGKKASDATDKYNKTSKETEKQAKRTSNLLNQAGFQIQDFAVQIQGGTSAFVAFSQQGSQLFSVFSPMLGLTAALAGIIGGQLYSALGDATEATDLFDTALKGLDKTIEESSNGTQILTEEFEKLVKFSRAAAVSQLNSEIIKLNEAINSGRKSIRENLAALGEWNIAFLQTLDLSELMTTRGFGRFGTQLSNIADEFKITTEQAGEFTRIITELFRKEIDINEFRRSFDELFVTLDEKGQKRLLAFRDSLAEISNQTITAEEKLQLLERTVRDLDGALQDSTQSGIDFSQSLEDRLSKHFEIEAKRKENLKKENEEILNLENKFSSETDGILNKRLEQRNKTEERLEAQRINNMRGALRRGATLVNSENRKQFEIGKAAAISEAVISGYQAAVKAYASAPNPFVGAALAALSAAATGSYISQIQSTEFRGRAQGGQVRAGQSYVVGENGREVLTMGNMGGTITPNHKLAANDGAPMQVVTNVKIVGGNPEATANTSITKTDRQYIIDVVVDQMSNPSSKGRAGMARTSNIQNRGVR